MKKYYLRNDFPICLKGKPELGDVEISEKEYKRICKERNDQIEADRIAQEEALRPVKERRALIMERALVNAENELIDEGVLK